MIVDGVDLSKVDQKLVAKSAKRFKVAANGTLATTVKALKGKLEESDGEVGDCTSCGGAWPVELEACPFCGESDRDEAPSGKEESSASSSVMGGTDSEEPPDPSSRAMVPAPKTSAALGGGNAETRVAVPQKEEDLDKAVRAINVAKEQGAKHFWAVVQILKKVVDTNLWKTRTDDQGSPLYKSWTDFALKELEFSRTYAERLLKVTREFTAQTVTELGVNKLVLVYSAPPEHRQRVLDAAKAGASRAKLQEAVKDLRQKAGAKNMGRGTAAKAAPKVDRDEMTLALLLGKKQTIALYAAKKDAKGEWKPAKKFEDVPHGWLDLPNGVRLVVQVLRAPSGQLKLSLTARREA